MSDKRFVVNKEGIFDNKTKKVYLFVAYDWIECEIYEVVELLNKLAEEKERLKKEVENLQSNMMESLGNHRKYEKSLEEENKELKQQLDKIPKNIKEIWLK